MSNACTSLALASLVAAGWLAAGPATGALWVLGTGLLAVAAATSQRFQGATFALGVATAVVAALSYPERFQTFGAFELKALIVPLIQLIMFGMGATLSVADFVRVLKMPRAVFIGLMLQFSIMPMLGAGLAAVSGLPPAIAAGVVLVGSCPGGVASNVMAFLAKGNVALSVTMTACSTLVSPLATPLLMKLLAGRYLALEFLPMMFSILKMVLLPVVMGLVLDGILRSTGRKGPWVERLLSRMAMFATCLVIAIITALSREQLLAVGLTVVSVAVVHNVTGYLLGYAGALLLKLDEASRRTVAIEVGLQNSGMASGLAVNVLKSSAAALPPAIFGPWMNISGSMLASWWRARQATQR